MLMDLLIHEKASFRRWAEKVGTFQFFWFLFDPRSVLQVHAVTLMAKIFTSPNGIHCKDTNA